MSDSEMQSTKPAGSAWRRVNAVMAKADKLEALIQLRLERHGETRSTAMEWAREMYARYSPNAEVSIER